MPNGIDKARTIQQKADALKRFLQESAGENRPDPGARDRSIADAFEEIREISGWNDREVKAMTGLKANRAETALANNALKVRRKVPAPIREAHYRGERIGGEQMREILMLPKGSTDQWDLAAALISPGRQEQSHNQEDHQGREFRGPQTQDHDVGIVAPDRNRLRQPGEARQPIKGQEDTVAVTKAALMRGMTVEEYCLDAIRKDAQATLAESERAEAPKNDAKTVHAAQALMKEATECLKRRAGNR